jgi:hypothetical protein
MNPQEDRFQHGELLASLRKEIEDPITKLQGTVISLRRELPSSPSPLLSSNKQ